jgi:hypothetical protein
VISWDELADFDSSNPADHWRELFEDVEPVGSRVTCDPAPTTTDADYLCKRSWWSGVPHRKLEAAGFRSESEHYDNEDEKGLTRFLSYRRTGDNVNLIITSDQDFFERFLVATRLCTRLNLLNKPDREALFQAVLYGAEAKF